MGLFLSWFVLRKWFTIAGFAVAMAALLPWPAAVLRDVLGALGLALMLAQVPVAIRRARKAERPPPPN
jgi:hypothetical protein